MSLLHNVLFFVVLLQIPLSSRCIAPTLPMGDSNVVVLTDIHAWVGGHRNHEGKKMDADLGDILSFYERLRYHCHQQGEDIWLVNNGDFVHGTGLSENPPVALVPLLEKVPWDVINIGNHELYQSETVSYITQPGGFVHWFGDRYLTSNVVHASSRDPLGGRFRYLIGKNSTVLTFGFLYNMKGASPLVQVEMVEDVVRSEWFLNALQNQEKFDAVMVLAHMDLVDSLVQVILDAIRDECGSNMPVQFITGHTHYRGHLKMDNFSTSFEAGRYLDTVGFASFPKKQSVDPRNANQTNGTHFQHQFIDTKVASLKQALGIKSELATTTGAALSRFTRKTQEQLGLNRVVGCSPRRFQLNKDLFDKDSLWTFYMRQVIRNQFANDNSSMLVIMNSGALRYDLFKGEITMDDVIAVAPFNDTIFRIAANINGSAVLALNQSLNQVESDDKFKDISHLPNYILSGLIKEEENYDLFVLEWEIPGIGEVLSDIYDGDLLSDETGQGTTALLFDFLQEYWSCGRSWNPKEHFSNKGRMSAFQFVLLGFFVLAIIDTTALCVIAGVFAFRKWHSPQLPPILLQNGSTHSEWEVGSLV